MSDSKVKIKLNKSGILAVLKSQMMMNAVTDAAIRQGEIESSFVGFDRVHVIVKKEDASAD